MSRDDLLTFFGWRGELDALEILGVSEAGASYEEFAPQLAAMLRRTVTLLAVEPSSGQPCGFVQAYDINSVERWCYMLTYFASDHRAQRVGLEASVGFWDFLFSYLNLRKIYFDVSELNSGWLRAVPNGLGILWREEGVFRGHTQQDGRLWDVTRYAIYRERWMELRDFLLLLFSLGDGQDGTSTGEPRGAGGARAGVAPTARGTADDASSGRSWFGRRRADARISPRMDLVGRYVASELEGQLNEVVDMMTDGIVYTSPMTGTVTGRHGVAALLAFRQRMRDAAERAGKVEQVITWSLPEEDADAVKIRGCRDPGQEIELVWEFDAENKITAFSTLGSTGLLVKWVLGDEPPL